MEQLGLPRVVTESRSPDGRYLASIRNEPAIDPPNQTLWVTEGNSGKQVAHLFPDVEWADQIAWAPDSTHVVFLIEGTKALTYWPGDGRTGLPVALAALREYSYPQPLQIRELRYEGQSVAYLVCERRRPPVGQRVTNAGGLWNNPVAACRPETAADPGLRAARVTEPNPMVFSAQGFRFFFYTAEERRAHVHVKPGAGGEAKFWIEPNVELANTFGLTPAQLSDIRKLVDKHLDEIRRAWTKYFPRETH